MSLPPVTVTTPDSERVTLCRRDRSAVRPLDAAFTSGRRPGPGAEHVGLGERLAHRDVDRPEQVGDVVGGALRVVDRPVVVGVGGADVGELEPAVVGRAATAPRTRCACPSAPGTTTAMSLRTLSHGTVMWMPLAGRMLSGSLPSSRARTSSLHTPVALTTARARTSMRRPSASTTAPGRPVAVAQQLDDLGVVGHHGAVVERRGAQDREREAGVVGGGVVVEVGAGQPLLGQRRHVGHGLRLLEALVELADAGAAGEVVHPHRAAERPGHLRVDQAVLREDRDEERQEPHEVRGVAAQPLPLAQGLVDEADVAVLQVAQAAVHELRALRRRAAGEVVALDQRGAQAAAGGVEGHPGAGDAAADHEHVERLGAQLLQRRGAVERTLRHQVNRSRRLRRSNRRRPSDALGAGPLDPAVALANTESSRVVSTWPSGHGPGVGLGHRPPLLEGRATRPAPELVGRHGGDATAPRSGRSRSITAEARARSIRRGRRRAARRAGTAPCDRSRAPPDRRWASSQATISLTCPPRELHAVTDVRGAGRRCATVAVVGTAVTAKAVNTKIAARTARRRPSGRARTSQGTPADSSAASSTGGLPSSVLGMAGGGPAARSYSSRWTGSDSTAHAAFSSCMLASAASRSSGRAPRPAIGVEAPRLAPGTPRGAGVGRRRGVDPQHVVERHPRTVRRGRPVRRAQPVAEA